jgi:predicted ATPase
VGGSDAVAQIRQGFTGLGRARLGGGAPCFAAALAEAFWKTGHHDEALEVVALGFAQAEETGSHHFDAGLLRLQADISLERGGLSVGEGESLLHRALAIARQQEAKWFELRAATSLARLLRDQGRRDEARALLHPVYAWFTEGFDTAPLKDAKALLDELV